MILASCTYFLYKAQNASINYLPKNGALNGMNKTYVEHRILEYKG